MKRVRITTEERSLQHCLVLLVDTFDTLLPAGSVIGSKHHKTLNQGKGKKILTAWRRGRRPFGDPATAPDAAPAAWTSLPAFRRTPAGAPAGARSASRRRPPRGPRAGTAAASRPSLPRLLHTNGSNPPAVPFVVRTPKCAVNVSVTGQELE